MLRGVGGPMMILEFFSAVLEALKAFILFHAF